MCQPVSLLMSRMSYSCVLPTVTYSVTGRGSLHLNTLFNLWSHEVWDMQKERRAKNCFEDLTTQLQEEVKLVTRLTLFPRPCDPRSSRLLQASPSMDMHGYHGVAKVLYSRCPAAPAGKHLETIWPYVAYHCADQSGVYLNSTIAHQGLVMQVPFLQTLDARALRFLIGRLSDPRQARLSQADKFFLQ